MAEKLLPPRANESLHMDRSKLRFALPVSLTLGNGGRMREIVSDPNLVAYCGLYCGACRSYLSGRCPGCHENSRATWCKIRTCCADQSLKTCADCVQFPNPHMCRKFNNPIAKAFSFVFRSDRAACIQQIRNCGIQGHADNMSETKRHTIKR